MNLFGNEVIFTEECFFQGICLHTVNKTLNFQDGFGALDFAPGMLKQFNDTDFHS